MTKLQRKRGPKPKPRNNPVIVCACGCNLTRLKYDDHYRLRKFITYHRVKGGHHTEETKRKISEANRGRKHTPLELAKMREANRLGINGMLGRKHSQETIAKISTGLKLNWVDRKKKLNK